MDIHVQFDLKHLLDRDQLLMDMDHGIMLRSDPNLIH